jgi:hypothetical protein
MPRIKRIVYTLDYDLELRQSPIASIKIFLKKCGCHCKECQFCGNPTRPGRQGSIGRINGKGRGANITALGVLNSWRHELKAPCGDIVHGRQRAVWSENAV